MFSVYLLLETIVYDLGLKIVFLNFFWQCFLFQPHVGIFLFLKMFRIARSCFSTKRVVVVDGCRLPFCKSLSVYNDVMSYDLARDSIKGLLNKTALDPKLVEYVIMGTVIQEVGTSNIAREAALGAGIPKDVPAHTVTMACISSSQAICTGAEKILAGKADVVIAGGSETFSDVPIRFSREMRKRFLAMNKNRKLGALKSAMAFFKGFSLSHLVPQTPAIQNFHTREVMGNSSDRLAARFKVSREEQDRFAVDSHHKAAKAHEDGYYKDEIIPYHGSQEENGIMKDTSFEKMQKLKPAFIKPHGTHTAANSSFLTDGAAATLLMSEEKAIELGFTPKASIKDWEFVAVDPFEDLLLGPTFAIHKVLASAGLELKDMDFIEFHEAFAGQVLANINALKDDKFGKTILKRSGKVGEMDMTKVNTWGGSLSLGHPFGATGARLLTTASNKLQKLGGKYALLAACADSGLAHACIVENYQKKH